MLGVPKKRGDLCRPPLFDTKLQFRLERELSHYLKNTRTGQGTRERTVRCGRWAGRLHDLTERSVGCSVNRVLEVRVIQHVVRIGSELKAQALCYTEILPKAEVGVEVVRPTVGIPYCVPEPSRCRIQARVAWTGQRWIRLARELSRRVALHPGVLAGVLNRRDRLSQ